MFFWLICMMQHLPAGFFLIIQLANFVFDDISLSASGIFPSWLLCCQSFVLPSSSFYFIIVCFCKFRCRRVLLLRFFGTFSDFNCDYGKDESPRASVQDEKTQLYTEICAQVVNFSCAMKLFLQVQRCNCFFKSLSGLDNRHRFKHVLVLECYNFHVLYQRQNFASCTPPIHYQFRSLSFHVYHGNIAFLSN